MSEVSKVQSSFTQLSATAAAATAARSSAAAAAAIKVAAAPGDRILAPPIIAAAALISSTSSPTTAAAAARASSSTPAEAATGARESSSTASPSSSAAAAGLGRPGAAAASSSSSSSSSSEAAAAAAAAGATGAAHVVWEADSGAPIDERRCTICSERQSLQAPPLLYCLPPWGSGGPDGTLAPLEPPGAGTPDSAAAKGSRSQQVWNSAPGSIAGDTQRERGPKTRSGGHDAPWMASYGSDLLDPQAAQSRLAEAAPSLDTEEAAPHCFDAAATARKRRWEILLGNERLLLSPVLFLSSTACKSTATPSLSQTTSDFGMLASFVGLLRTVAKRVALRKPQRPGEWPAGGTDPQEGPRAGTPRDCGGPATTSHPSHTPPEA
ncbi:hypothetical protein ENH_00075420 [Eimeria necatrix]|uniref:Uncharacterized protein n=1 Tax=Eimeria necatrix TaxID=51315 RepID=U6N3J9_9EIME|nr:hypothetical protein ENH_00075420 [Eimeria necatrix]CDJ69884.1 hypothetical protein ENH_00075420 [Eimeria necatrix]